MSLTQVLLTLLAIRVTPLCPATGRERRTWLCEKTRSPFGFFGRLSKAGHGHGICALMHSVSRKRDLSLCRGHSHFNRFAHYGSIDPTSTGSYLSQPQVWYSPISSFLLPEAALASALGPNTTEHLCLQSIWHPVLPQLHYKPSLCQHWNKHLERKKNWSYLVGKQTGTAQKLAGFQEPNTCISLLSSVLFSVLTLLFQYYSTMFVCFL